MYCGMYESSNGVQSMLYSMLYNTQHFCCLLQERAVPGTLLAYHTTALGAKDALSAKHSIHYVGPFDGHEYGMRHFKVTYFRDKPGLLQDYTARGFKILLRGCTVREVFIQFSASHLDGFDLTMETEETGVYHGVFGIRPLPYPSGIAPCDANWGPSRLFSTLTFRMQ